jgi:hypothetical protein
MDAGSYYTVFATYGVFPAQMCCLRNTYAFLMLVCYNPVEITVVITYGIEWSGPGPLFSGDALCRGDTLDVQGFSGPTW